MYIRYGKALRFEIITSRNERSKRGYLSQLTETHSVIQLYYQRLLYSVYGDS